MRQLGALAPALAVVALAGCRMAGEAAPDPAAAAPGVWTMTEHGPCMETPPPFEFRPAPACAPVSDFPGYIFLGVPYLGTAVGLGSAFALSEATACQAEALQTLAYNADLAEVLGQQCMGREDVSEMQRALAALELYRGGPTGEIDPATFAAMRAWKAAHDVEETELGPTKVFAARVIRSAEPSPRARVLR